MTFWQDLFTRYNATAGGSYEFADASTLFTDTAGNTPVVSAGDPIALIKDKSGLGHDFAQPVLANRPAYYVDAQGIGSGHFSAASPSYMDGSGLNCDQVITWAAYLYKSPQSGRLLDTRGAGNPGTVKGWYLGAADGGSSPIFIADDGAGSYVYNDANLLLAQNIEATISWYTKGNSVIYPKAVTQCGSRELCIGTNSIRSNVMGDITSSALCRMGASSTPAARNFDGYLYAVGSMGIPAGTVLKASDRDAILDYMRNISTSI